MTTQMEPNSTSTSPIGDMESIRVARAYLVRVAEPPAPNLARFIARHGPCGAAEFVRRNEVPPEVAQEVAARREIWLAEEDLSAAAQAGARLVIPEDDDWPAWPFVPLDVAQRRGGQRYGPAGRAMAWAGQPIALYVRGQAKLADLAQHAVAIVGARAATGYGEHVATEWAHGLSTAGYTVVSGAAYGIDAAAHRGALAAGGPTIAVLGCGVDVSYPAGHASLLARICVDGAVISEYPPGTPPAKHRFLVRNRLIATLGAGTVVVEAGKRSGSRNTAATAAALGRLVLAAPGPVDSSSSIGCHDMIRSGDAILVSSVGEVLESIGRLGVDLPPSSESDRRDTDGLDERALRVHGALDRRAGRSAEQLAVLSGVPVAEVRAVLPALELADLVRRCDAGWLQNPERCAATKERGDA
jgi:DNA processing protein